MSHTHHYSFWHAHEHVHEGTFDSGIPVQGNHTGGHYHNWMQTHSHGAGGRNPHTHKDRQYHEESDPETKHHHAVDAHDMEEE